MIFSLLIVILSLRGFIHKVNLVVKYLSKVLIVLINILIYLNNFYD